MKNKKLFAILTLVCFMFTLMPVAAFAAPAVTNSVYVSADGTTYSDEATVAPGAFYVKAAATTSAVVSNASSIADSVTSILNLFKK